MELADGTSGLHHQQGGPSDDSLRRKHDRSSSSLQLQESDVIPEVMPNESSPGDEIGKVHWSGFTVGALCMLSSGTLYAFGAYSDDLKLQLGWTESQMEIVGYLGDCGVYVSGPVTGAYQDIYGPRSSCAIAACLLILGYGGMAFLLSTRLCTSSLAFGALLFMSGAGSGFMYVSALSSNIELFPDKFRGKLVGSLVSLFGLSALAYTLANQGLFQGQDTVGLLAFMAVTCGSSALLGSVLLPMVLRTSGHLRWAESSPRGLSSHIRNAARASAVVFSSWTFWLFFAIFFLLSGSGLMVINNIGSFVVSVVGGKDATRKSSLVATLSACNCMGRLLSGLVSDAVTWRRGVFFTVSAAFFAAAAAVTLAVPQLAVLHWLVAGVGLGYGVVWSVLPTTISEVFGPQNFGQNWGWALLAPAAGGLLFNFMAGWAYDREGTGGGVCLGWDCFRIPLIVILGCSVPAGVLGVVSVPHTHRGNKQGFLAAAE